MHLFQKIANGGFVTWSGFKGQFPLGSDEAHLSSAIEWLCRAQDVHSGDGVAGLYDLWEGWYAAYPETTGYIIETFLRAGEFLGRPELIDRGIRLGNWEISVQLPSGGVRGGLLRVGVSDDPIIFNTGQVMIGWNALFKALGDAHFLAAAVRAGEWLAELLQEDGVWHRHVYRGFCGTYHSRVAWAMLETGVQSNQGDLIEKASRHIEWVLSQQSPDGYFQNMGFQPGAPALTHTIAYTLEGLAESAAVLAQIDANLSTRCLSAVHLACEGLLRAFEVRGTLWADYKDGWIPAAERSVCVTGVAQTARVFMRECIRTGDLRFLNAGLKLIDFAKGTQILTGEYLDIRGGIPGSWPLWGKYQRFRYPNWATKFFCDAILEKSVHFDFGH